MGNRLIDVQNLGQSIWYDNIRRGLITSGELKGMVDNDGLLGVTSNPAIFEKAVAGSSDYNQALKALVTQGLATANDIYERLAIEDIQLAADVLYPAFVRTQGRDGYVSLEVSPYLAHDTAATIEEAHRLHRAVGRDNVLIKVPATPAGIPAIEQLIGDGININVTLLFALSAYEAVAEAFTRGVERLAERGADLRKVASVASFFISRIDSLLDDKLAKAIEATRDPAQRARLQSLMGRVAIANAKNTYARYLELYSTPRWQRLAERGARPQRLLWASTSTKNPKYPKTIYIDELIGADTVNTVPAETLNDFRDQGDARPHLTENWESNLAAARALLADLEGSGVSLAEATDFLLTDGVQKFSDAFDKLLAAVEKKRTALLVDQLATQTCNVGSAAPALHSGLEEWRRDGKIRRLWRGDASLWSGADEGDWLGWLHVVGAGQGDAETLRRFADEVRAQGITHVLLLGMGGSSLCPDVLRQTFGKIAGFPELVVLDSTVPAQVLACAQRIDLSKTLCIVSSKSGGTVEPNVFKQYFFERLQQALGSSAAAGRRFVAITDPGTKMEEVARRDGFGHIFYGVPSIGGRYSALSSFGMVPAAAMGIDVAAWRERTRLMVSACAASVPPEVNPGVELGVLLGSLARSGRDKVTFVVSPGLAALGAWLEQLIAESTGKEGVGLIPIADEEIGAAAVYGDDRVFAYIRLQTAPSAAQDAAVDVLERAGHPVVRISLHDTMEIGQELFRWEMATAVAGSVLGINPFNQPDVEASKIATRKLTEAYESKGELPREAAILESDGIKLFADAANASAISAAAKSRDLVAYLAAHLGRVAAGDYIALNAYLDMNEANRNGLQAIRHTLRDAKRVATTLGFGPRFLHSTGQLHKGGPNSGVFLQITSDDSEDVAIPGQKYTFGILKQFQAQGDFEVLAERKRRALRIHLGADVAAGLSTLRRAIERLG